MEVKARPHEETLLSGQTPLPKSSPIHKNGWWIVSTIVWNQSETDSCCSTDKEEREATDTARSYGRSFTVSRFVSVLGNHSHCRIVFDESKYPTE